MNVEEAERGVSAAQWQMSEGRAETVLFYSGRPCSKVVHTGMVSTATFLPTFYRHSAHCRRHNPPSAQRILTLRLFSSEHPNYRHERRQYTGKFFEGEARRLIAAEEGFAQAGASRQLGR